MHKCVVSTGMKIVRPIYTNGAFTLLTFTDSLRGRLPSHA